MCGPRSPQPGAPYTYVTTPAFLELNGLPNLRDLPDLDRLEPAGLLGLRSALGISDDAEEEVMAQIETDDEEFVSSLSEE